MGAEVTVELVKYPSAPLRSTVTQRLGEDEHGVWLGAGRYVFLIPHEGWWKARHFPDGGWKIDIATPPEWDGDRVLLADLALDVRRYHWQSWVEDRHEFDQLVAAGTIPADVAANAERACDELLTGLWDEPFRSAGDRWLGRIRGQFDGAVLLDMGGVLQRSGTGEVVKRWEDELSLADGSIREAFAQAIGPGWEGGRSPEEITWRLRAALGVDYPTLSRLRRDVVAEGGLDPDLVAMLATRPKGVAAAVVSNNGADIRPIWEDAFSINDVVDLVVISGEERINKPDPGLLEIAAARLGVPAEACLFVDDQPDNIAAARAIGMAAHVHTAAEPATDELRAFIDQHL